MAIRSIARPAGFVGILRSALDYGSQLPTAGTRGLPGLRAVEHGFSVRRTRAPRLSSEIRRFNEN